MAGIWILGENRDQTMELLTLAMQLAEQVGVQVTALTWDNQAAAQEYIDCGADQVLLMAAPAADQPLEDYVPVITEEARQADPDIFLVAVTPRLKEIAARVAARLNTGLCSGCLSLQIDAADRSLSMERLVYGGAAVQTVTVSTRPQMATIPPRTYAIAVARGKREGQIRELAAPSPGKIKIIDRKSRTRQSVDITEARILVCVGRGLENQQDMQMVQELAEVLGAEIACTRPIAEEMHWLPEETYIGISGKQVKPDLYIGLGVSGQIQHVSGIRDARVICAINRDENAPIFEVSDLGLVGDLYTILPELIQQLKKVFKK